MTFRYGRRPVRTVAAALLTSAAVLAAGAAGGCGATYEGTGTQSCEPAPAGNLAAADTVPTALRPDGSRTIAVDAPGQGLVRLSALRRGAVPDVIRAYQRSAEGAGFTLVGSDFEVREYDLYLSGREGIAFVRVLPAACAGSSVAEVTFKGGATAGAAQPPPAATVAGATTAAP